MKTWMFVKTAACAAAICGSVSAFAAGEAETQEKETDEATSGWSWAMGEGISFGETSIVATEVSLAFDSKYLSYGLVDNNEPILTPGAYATWFDWVTVGVEALFDVTRYGAKKVGGEELYANRQFKYRELDPSVSIDHSFSADDFAWLPTTVEFSLGYSYEYYSRSYAVGQDDTQFVTFEVSLPDLWFEPAFLYERDIDRDNGTYLNLDLGHRFELCEGLTFRPSVAQGFGNTQRVRGYLDIDRAGLMDTCVKGTCEWTIAEGVTLSGYVAYSDFVFDRHIRDAARDYEASGDWDDSWNFIGGLALTLAF